LAVWADGAWRLPPRAAVAGAYAKTRVWGLETLCDTQATGKTGLNPEIAEGVCDGPSQYIFAGYDPVNMGDPLGLCFGPWAELTCGELAGSFNPFSGGFWKRSGSFAGGYAKGVGEVVVSVGVATYNVTGDLLYDATGSHVYREQAEAADRMYAGLREAASDPGEFLKETFLSGIDQLYEAGARGDYFRAGEGLGRTVGQGAILADGVGSLSLKLAPSPALALATGETLGTGGVVMLSGSSGPLVSSLTLMADGSGGSGSGSKGSKLHQQLSGLGKKAYGASGKQASSLLQRMARKAGFEVKPGGKHLKVINPETGKTVTVIPHSPHTRGTIKSIADAILEEVGLSNV
ncbi:MAG: type II toxin-antitoxin system HicA family toxin, partial [Acidobacteria bacterium]|nr:type II toxin-antitoxin system HicA family toxin [Acidobacteriota bacterium]